MLKGVVAGERAFLSAAAAAAATAAVEYCCLLLGGFKLDPYYIHTSFWWVIHRM